MFQQESSLPDELIENSVTTPKTCSRRRMNIKTSPMQSSIDWKIGENITTTTILSFVSSVETQTNPFDMSTLRNKISAKVIQSYIPMEEEQNHQCETFVTTNIK